MVELRLTELPARYNAAETFIDSHRGVRESTIAIRCQGKSVTYGELADNVDRCGNALRELGIGIEQRVVILCLDSPAFAYAFFGAIKIGAVPVPANTLLTPRDLAYIVNDSRAVAIVVSAPLLPKVAEIRAEIAGQFYSGWRCGRITQWREKQVFVLSSAAKIISAASLGKLRADS